MALISVTLNCSHSQPSLPPPYPPNILLCHILSQIVANSTSHSPVSNSVKHFPLPSYPSSLPFSPWKPGDAYSLGGASNVQTR